MPVMLSGVYCVLTLSPITPSARQTIGTLLLFFIASIGIGGFGHLVNDLFDVDQDLASGADSLIANRQTFKVVRKFLIVILLAWLPWLWLPSNPLILSLLILEFVLFLCYSMPPIRLKDRGALGLIADSLYSYTISNAVALLVFAKLAQFQMPIWFTGLWVAWSFTVGLRQILGHQIEDLSRDQLAGIRTFVSIHGWKQSFAILERLLLPIETSFFVTILIFISRNSPAIIPGFLLFTVLVLWKQHLTGIRPVFDLLQSPSTERLFFINNTLLHRFYTQCMPLLAIVPLILKNPQYFTLAVMHYALFQNSLKWFIMYELPEFRRLKHTS